jgi:HK97 family phage major capsid protein
MNTRELREKRANLIANARAIVDAADKESRVFNADEQKQYDAIMVDVDKMAATIEQREKLEKLESNLAQTVGEAVKPENESRANPNAEKTAKAWNAFLRNGAMGAEVRALQADADISGGFFTSPQTFVNKLVMAINDLVFIRQWGTPNTVSNAQSLGFPALSADPADADWTSELAVGSEDSTMAFGKRELWPKPLAKLIKVSGKLLRLNPDVESLVIQRLAYKFQIAWEKAALTGTGSNQPLGVFTADVNGISTGRDISTDNATTAFTADGLKNAKYGLKAGYWPSAKWIFHRDGVKMLAKLKDGDGNYLWTESLRAGEPDRLMGLPMVASEYAPNTFTTGLYVGIVGDFSYYWYADALDFGIQRLNELYAATNQVGFIGRLESDGMPVLEDAFVRVKLA